MDISNGYILMYIVLNGNYINKEMKHYKKATTHSFVNFRSALLHFSLSLGHGIISPSQNADFQSKMTQI